MKVELPPEDEEKASKILGSMSRFERMQKPRQTLPLTIMVIVLLLILLVILFYFANQNKIVAMLEHLMRPDSLLGSNP